MSETPEAAAAQPSPSLDGHADGSPAAATPGTDASPVSGASPETGTPASPQPEEQTSTPDTDWADWAAQARALLDGAPFDVARARAWQRDAARAGAPLSREPLAHWRAQLAARVQAVQDVQHQAQVQREAALLLAQRIDWLSTKSWREALAALDVLRADIGRWQAQCAALQAVPHWGSMPAAVPAQLEAASARLDAVRAAFEAALQQTQTAALDATAPLPSLPVWADELRAARGLPPQNILHSSALAQSAVSVASAAHATHEAAADDAKAPRRPQADRAAAASVAITQALAQFQATIAAAPAPHRQATDAADASGAPAAPADTRAPLHTLREAIRLHGRLVDDALAAQVDAAMRAAGDTDGWPRAQADALRQHILEQAQALLAPPEGQTFAGGHKLQQALRQLRAQWRVADLGNRPNGALWKKFDQACNAIHLQIQAWQERQRQQTTQAKAQRQALIAEVQAWGLAHTPNTPADDAAHATPDWRASVRSLREFAARWRACGQVHEKLYAQLLAQFRQAMHHAGAPLHAAQQASTQRRQALIDEAAHLATQERLDMAAVRALQQRWQQEAHTVPLPRMQEQQLWEAFRAPLDQAFQQRKDAPPRMPRPPHGASRPAHATHAPHATPPAALSEHERRVLAASTALQEASAAGDAPAIHAAVAALQAALSGEAMAGASSTDAAPTPASSTPAAAAASDAGAADAPAPAPAAVKPVLAVRGDDRPGAQKNPPPGQTGPAGHAARRSEARAPRGAERAGGSNARPGAPWRSERGPRLAEPVFRAQREAFEHAQHALRRLAVQTHGEALSQILAAWQARDAAQLPAAQQLGSRVNASARSAWQQALARPAAADSAAAEQALLRLEMAAELPTPAQYLDARRALQLQLLTRRNDPPPAQTWAQDAACVFAEAHAEARARRLRDALKRLLRA